ncbi:MAG: MinD/ParA family protein [Betaproteobacteria bacterium]|jgi:flagellar biosynthesis protein FlhG|nr:MinD/ParA family protein [Betaproteobacteria bacterium]
MEKPTHTQVIGITSGKPGVGKTTVSVNLAVALHDMGYSVMILDANTSAANAQTALGSICPFKLEDFFSGKKSLQDIILKRRYGIQLIAGATAVHDMATLSAEQSKRTLEAFSALEEHLDFLIVDMPPGTEMSILAFMASTSRRFIVVRNDASGITDAYAMIKTLCSDYQLDEIYLIINGAHSDEEGQKVFDHLNLISTKFLQRSLHYLGCLKQDELIREASVHHQAITEHAPTSTGARDIRHLAHTTSTIALENYLEGGIAHFMQKLFHLNSRGPK